MKPETIILIILGAIMLQDVVLRVVAKRVEDGIVRQAGSSAPAVRSAAKKAGETFARDLGIRGVASLAISRI